MTTPHRTLLQQALDALTNCLSEHGHRCNRCDSEIDEGGKLITALRAALAAPEPADQITSMDYGMFDEATNPPAPVPLTDTETHAELWKLAVRKGLITVRSELIDPRNHGTRVSWMQGHDKACDISNDAAAHGIAASPAAPAAPVVPLTDERITKALRRAFSLGQTYWQQADSDSYTQNAKSDETRQKFETLIVETLNGITGASK